MENLPTIDIICPVRNRQFVISYFLEHIYNLNYPKNLISIIVCLNDSNDDSDKILTQFKQSHQNEYKNVKILTYNLNAPPDSRYSSRLDLYKNLPKIRNLLLQHCTSDYVFSIDSDILCKPDTLSRLLFAKKDIISAIIYNGYTLHDSCQEGSPWKWTNIMNIVDGNYVHFSKRCRQEKYNKDYIINVDMTGAVYLFTKEVAKSVKYNFHKNGEDLFFCEEAKRQGFKIYCNINLFCDHIMNESILKEYLKGEV